MTTGSITVLDSTATTQYLETGSGAGTAISPYISPAATGIGTTADSAVTNPASSGSIIAFLKGLLTNTPALGSATSANSSPVVIASDQAALPTTGTGVVQKSPSITVTAGAYVSGQVVGGLITITNALRTSGGSGYIQGVVITVKTALTAPYDVFFFSSNPSNGTYTDNTTFALNTTDAGFICGIVHCNDLVSGGTPQVLQATNISIPLQNGSSNTSLYAIIVIRGGQTYASTSAVGMNVTIAQN